jgi:alpha-tubulin suppressor-like RCC1 family protein
MGERLFTWGSARHGQLGHGDELLQSAPRVMDPTNVQGASVTALCMSGTFVLALTKRQDVWSWGTMTNGNLSADHGGEGGDARAHLLPRKIRFFAKKGVQCIAAGSEHVVVVLKSGYMYAWGNGAFGQLGLGHEEDRAEPTLVPFFGPRAASEQPAEAPVPAPAPAPARPETTSTSTSTSTLTSTSTPTLTSTSTPTSATHKPGDTGVEERLSLAKPAGGSLAGAVTKLKISLKRDGPEAAEEPRAHADAAASAGEPAAGAAAVSATATAHATAHADGALAHAGRASPPEPIMVQQVAAGKHHTLVLDDKGRVYSWGLGLHGRLGHGDDKNRLTPALIETIAHENIEPLSVHCGWEHSAIVTKYKGQVYTWGSNASSQLGGSGLKPGSSDDTPKRVTQWLEAPSKKKNNGVKEGRDHSALKAPKIVHLSCGAKHNLAVSDEGHVYSWGRGELGRLGHGDERPKKFPSMIGALEHVRVVSAAAGAYHSLAVAEDGSLYVWGENEGGRLGLGPKAVNVTKPTLLPATAPGAAKRIKVLRAYAGTSATMACGELDEENRANKCCVQ